MDLHYKKYGEKGEHLLILHGLFGMLDNWHTLGGKFSEKYQVWLIDQRNHGKSGHSEHFSYELLADDLYRFMEKHDIAQANLIGHSMGGKTVMQFAFEHPEKIDKLVVADIAPKAYDSHHDTIIEALQGLDLKQINRREEADQELAKKIDDAGTRQFLLKNLSREPEGYKWKMNLDSLVANYDDIIGGLDPEGHFDGPTLFIRGTNSSYIQEEDKAPIREQFPKARFVDFEGVGHWVHAEAPQKFLQTVLDFLK